jgi:C4-dicarboxylate transporter DctQ subunit
VSAIFSALAPAGVFYPVFVLLAALALGVRALARRRWGAARWDTGVRAIERFVLTLFILAMVGFAVLQIVLRNVFHGGLIWIEPLLRALVLWIGFTGAVVATGRLRHIHMDLAGRLLPPKPQLLLQRATLLAAALICLALARAAWIFLSEECAYGSLGFLSIPNWVLMSVTFLGFGLCAVRFAARAGAPRETLAALSLEVGPVGEPLGGASTPAAGLSGTAPHGAEGGSP